MMNKNYKVLFLLLSSFSFSQSKQSSASINVNNNVNKAVNLINEPSKKASLSSKISNNVLNSNSQNQNSLVKEKQLLDNQNKNTSINNRAANNQVIENNKTVVAKNIQNAVNHLFNNDPTNPDAFLQIKNQSECDLKVKIEGKNVYYMDVPKMGENFVLVPKGKYYISTEMCNAQYSSTKDLNKDMMIKLVANKNARN